MLFKRTFPFDKLVLGPLAWEVKAPTFISNFANADQVKVAEVISIVGDNFYMEEDATDMEGKIVPHAFSVWSRDGSKHEFMSMYHAMFGGESLDDILTKWFPPT